MKNIIKELFIFGKSLSNKDGYNIDLDKYCDLILHAPTFNVANSRILVDIILTDLWISKNGVLALADVMDRFRIVKELVIKDMNKILSNIDTDKLLSILDTSNIDITELNDLDKIALEKCNMYYDKIKEYIKGVVNE